MGISADLILLKKADKNYNGEILPYNIDTYPDFVREEIKKDFGEGKYFVGKILCYIGGGNEFESNVLRNYDNTIGLLKLKDNLDVLNKETKNRILTFLENYFKIDYEYILERNDLYIELNY
jgi:hypothetical protein